MGAVSLIARPRPLAIEPARAAPAEIRASRS
jgi:hypothetical protein